jgi:hypothetical protein
MFKPNDLLGKNVTELVSIFLLGIRLDATKKHMILLEIALVMTTWGIGFLTDTI